MDEQHYSPPPEQPHGYRQPPPRTGMGAGLTIFQSFILSGCVSVLVPILLCIGFFVTLFFLFASQVEEASSALDSLSSASVSSVREKVLRDGVAANGTIALVKVHGTITGDGSPLDGTGTMVQVAEELRAAAADNAVKVILLQIDSPGGGLTASDLLYYEVRRIRDQGKPVIAWAAGMMASGGYYIAVGADLIIASPTATVGSIGVIMRHFQVQELLEKLGIEANPIVSGERKDIGSPFREMTPEEREVLEQYIAAAHQRFVEIVAEGRNMPVEQVMPLADGSIFTAEKAEQAGLIDRVGYLEDAIAEAEQLVGADNMRVISYRRAPGVMDILRGAGQGVAAGLMDSAVARPAPEPMAVWDGR